MYKCMCEFAYGDQFFFSSSNDGFLFAASFSAFALFYMYGVDDKQRHKLKLDLHHGVVVVVVVGHTRSHTRCNGKICVITILTLRVFRLAFLSLSLSLCSVPPHYQSELINIHM